MALAALILWPSGRAARADAGPETDNALVTLCGILETSAKAEGLPVEYFTKLIWRESSFRPDAVSPAGAQGVAQFMPGTASARGLVDPFDPASAIPASGEVPRGTRAQVGNLGLAAARLQRRRNRGRQMARRQRPASARNPDYVLALTGHDAEEWRTPTPPSSGDPRPVMPEPHRHPPHGPGRLADRLGFVCALGRTDRRQLLARLGDARF